MGNLPFETREDELLQLFGRFGSVARVPLLIARDTGRSRGFGFVELR